MENEIVLRKETEIHTVVWDGSFRQKYVALTRHAACNRVDGETDIDALSSEHGTYLGNCILRLRDSHSIAYDLMETNPYIRQW